jgi:hypothetical protein
MYRMRTSAIALAVGTDLVFPSGYSEDDAAQSS